MLPPVHASGPQETHGDEHPQDEHYLYPDVSPTCRDHAITPSMHNQRSAAPGFGTSRLCYGEGVPRSLAGTPASYRSQCRWVADASNCPFFSPSTVTYPPHVSDSVLTLLSGFTYTDI
jgi:hypothetical protein